MTTLSNLLASNNNRFPKFMTIVLVMMTSVIGLILLGTASLLLLPRAFVVDLINTLLSIGNRTPWHLSRAAGTVAYLLLAGSTVWGLLLSSKILKEAIPAVLSLAMHNFLSWLALAFTGLHALVLLVDNYYTYTLSDLTIPFIGPYRPVWVGIGIVGFYMMALVVLSFQFRKQIGQKRWRALHYVSFAVFALATIHGVVAGTDSSKLSMQIIYLGSGLLVIFLTNYRLFARNANRMRQQQSSISR